MDGGARENLPYHRNNLLRKKKKMFCIYDHSSFVQNYWIMVFDVLLSVCFAPKGNHFLRHRCSAKRTKNSVAQFAAKQPGTENLCLSAPRQFAPSVFFYSRTKTLNTHPLIISTFCSDTIFITTVRMNKDGDPNVHKQIETEKRRIAFHSIREILKKFHSSMSSDVQVWNPDECSRPFICTGMCS